MKKIIFLIMLVGLLFTQNVQATTTQLISGGTKDVLDTVVNFIIYDLPGIVKENFNKIVLPLWKEMYQWFDESVWEKIKPYTNAEIERRKQIAEEESKKEREELVEEIKAISINNNILENIKEFLINLVKIK